MKLLEHEGKSLLRSHGVCTPRYEFIFPHTATASLMYPFVLKSQVHTGNRKKKGGIVVVHNSDEFVLTRDKIFSTSIDGLFPEVLLAEEFINAEQELYVSFSYSTDTRSPVIALNKSGGSGIESATVTAIDLLGEFERDFAIDVLKKSDIDPHDQIVDTLCILWSLFVNEKLVLLEINPLFICPDKTVVAGDAKIVCDDTFSPLKEKRALSLGGDIAVIASGGGASMLNIDILMREKGKPANYVEYSGNPPASVVEELTVNVLSIPGLRGAWVVGGTANFTDIYETMSGFVAGLKKVSPKTNFPIVIRRDGPRQMEAKEMLEKFAKEGGYQIEVYGPELSMSQSAKRLIELMNVV